MHFIGECRFVLNCHFYNNKNVQGNVGPNQRVIKGKQADTGSSANELMVKWATKDLVNIYVR